jgi:hypothetical protein
MKGGIGFLEIILLFGSYKSSELRDIILLSAHRHIAVTMVSLTAGNYFSALFIIIIGSLVGGIADCFETLHCVHCCVPMNEDYKNFIDMDSNPLT